MLWRRRQTAEPPKAYFSNPTTHVPQKEPRFPHIRPAAVQVENLLPAVSPVPSISNSLFPVRRHFESAVRVFFRYHSFTLYILSARHPIAASSTRAAIISVSTIFSPSYSCNKNGIDYSTPFQQRTEKNCRLQQRLTRSAPCLFFRTGRRLDQVASASLSLYTMTYAVP